MKKIIAMLLIMCTVLSILPATLASAYEIKVTEDGLEYVAHEVLVDLNYVLDESIYNTENPPKFYGVDIVSVRHLFRYTTPEEWYDLYGDVTYVVVLADHVDEQTAIEIFESYDDVLAANLNNVYHYDDEDEEQAQIILGDVNLNGKIDARDYFLLKRAFFGTYALTEQGQVNGDINGNGKIDARDYLLLKRMFFGTYNPATSDEA